ncbi:MAG: general secretion pathway protein GspB [Pseudomonadota bacterium]
MSYILKALKRSQQERDLGQIPTLQATYEPAPTPDGRPLKKIGLLVVLNLAVVAVGLWVWDQGFLRNHAAHQSQTARQAATVETTDNDRTDPALSTEQRVSDPNAAKISQTQDLPPGDGEVEAVVMQETAVAAEPDIPSPISVEQADPFAALGAADKVIEQGQSNTTLYAAVAAYPPVQPLPLEVEPTQAEENATEGVVEAIAPEPIFPDTTEPLAPAAPSPLPTQEVAALPEVTVDEEANGPYGSVPHIKTLPRHFQLSLPDIQISLHVYDDQPARRFVRINRRKVGEGEEVGEGLQLDAITPRGLVLSFEGQQFRMDSL